MCCLRCRRLCCLPDCRPVSRAPPVCLLPAASLLLLQQVHQLAERRRAAGGRARGGAGRARRWRSRRRRWRQRCMSRSSGSSGGGSGDISCSIAQLHSFRGRSECLSSCSDSSAAALGEAEGRGTSAEGAAETAGRHAQRGRRLGASLSPRPLLVYFFSFLITDRSHVQKQHPCATAPPPRSSKRAADRRRRPTEPPSRLQPLPSPAAMSRAGCLLAALAVALAACSCVAAPLGACVAA